MWRTWPSIAAPLSQHDWDVVILLGVSDVAGDAASLAGSEYLDVVYNLVAGQPALDLALEALVQRCCLRLIQEGLLHSAHDCSDGGLAVTLAECAIQGQQGFQGSFTHEGRRDAALFGETPSRIAVSLATSDMARVESLCQEENVPYALLGTVGGSHFVLPGVLDIPLDALDDAWRHGLERALGE